MPDIRDLPENMNTAEFNKRFESIYSKPYQEMLKNIDQRIAACPVYKTFWTFQTKQFSFPGLAGEGQGEEVLKKVVEI